MNNISKTFWECTVCGDIHYGEGGPEVCPTCDSKDAYKSITEEEAKESMGFEE